MVAVTTLTLIASVIVTTGELLKTMPEYDKRQKKKWYEMVSLYNKMIKLPDDQICPTTVLNLQEEILTFNEIITKEAGNV